MNDQSAATNKMTISLSENLQSPWTELQKTNSRNCSANHDSMLWENAFFFFIPVLVGWSESASFHTIWQSPPPCTTIILGEFFFAVVEQNVWNK